MRIKEALNRRAPPDDAHMERSRREHNAALLAEYRAAYATKVEEVENLRAQLGLTNSALKIATLLLAIYKRRN